MRRILALACLALATAAPAASALPRLHAVRGSSPAIVTRDGRQVLLRGVNVNQLGDFSPQNPGLRPPLPLKQSAFAGIRGLGMNVVRWIVHGSALEPKRGAFDTAY